MDVIMADGRRGAGLLQEQRLVPLRGRPGLAQGRYWLAALLLLGPGPGWALGNLGPGPQQLGWLG